MRVIARGGIVGATMQNIADEAGVAKGTIYLYFQDRDALVEKTFENAISQLMKRIDAVLDQDLPFDAKIRGTIAAQLAFFSENRELFSVYMSLRIAEGKASKHKQTCHPQYRARAERFAEVLKKAMERGEIIDVDPYRLALFIIEGSTAIILERLSEASSPAESADVDLIVRLILDGVRKRSA